MKPNRPELWLALITLLALALRLARLDFQPLWWDEGYSIFFATRDFATMLARTAIDIHPPFYYALLQLWIAFAGNSAVGVRLLSVVIGVATIPLLYALARKLYLHPLLSSTGEGRGGGERSALIAALLLALSPFHIYYSQEVRMYGLVTLLGLASVYLFVRLLKQQAASSRQQAVVTVAYILTTTAALYTQYYAAFVIAFEFLIVLILVLRARARPLVHWLIGSLAHWIAAWLAIALLYLPWVIYAGSKLYGYVTSKIGIEKYAPLDPLTFLAQHLVAFSIGHLTEWTWLAWGSVVFIALALFGAVVEMRTRENTHAERKGLPHSHTLALGYLLVPLALGYLVNLFYPFHPIHGERLLLLAAPAFYLLVASGIAAIKRRAFAIAAVFALCALSALSLYDFYTVPRYPKDDYRPLIADMQSSAQPGDVFLAIYPWQIGYLEAYYTGAPLRVIETPSDAWINDPAQMQRDLDTLLQPGARVWLPALQTKGRILEDALDANLRPRTYSVSDNWYGTTRLELFAFAADPARVTQSVKFENGVTLETFGVSGEPVTAGQDIVRILFDWGNRVPSGYTASVRLSDAKGNVWAQDDREIASGAQRIGIAVPIGAPPGEYDLRLSAYRASNNETLRLANDSTLNSALLARVRVSSPQQPLLAAIPNRASIDFTDGIHLRGYATQSSLQQGSPAPITFFWQATQPLHRDYIVITQIQDAGGKVYATTQAPPALNVYPTSRWQPDEIVRDPQTILLRGDAPDGDYRIVVALLDSASNTQTQPIEIAKTQVKGRPHYFGAPTPSNKYDAQFGDDARLIGYDVSNDQRAVRLVLYWQALGTSETAYTVFAHIVAADGTLHAQRDHIPGAGAYPTTSWVKGEYLVDVYDISIPRDAPPGEYAVEIGMYDPTTGARLPVFDGTNQPVGDHSALPTRIAIR